MRSDGLQIIDGQWLDGLEFCRTAYDLLSEVKAEPGGVEELQGLSSRRAKKLLEEILPLAAFIQARYGPESRIRVRWCGGNQPFDAELHCSGGLVARGFLPAEQYLELTTAEPEHEYLVREHLVKHGGAFAAAGTRRDPATGEVVSEAIAVDSADEMAEFVNLIRRRVQAKAARGYPEGTALVIRCNPGGVVLDDEWADLTAAVRNALATESLPFRDVLLVHQGNGVARVGGRAS